MKIAIPYFSRSGHTHKLAEYIAKGVESERNVNSHLINIEDTDKSDLDFLHNANAIIFGAPTYMGSLAGPFKNFMDQTGDFWIEQKWKDKIAAGFTIGNNASGDKLNSLIQLSIFAAQHGMIWVGNNHIGSQYTKDGLGINSNGFWLGLAATSVLDKSVLISNNDAQSAKFFGQHIANATIRWNNN